MMVEGPDEHTARAKRLIAERKYDEAIRLSRRALLTRPDMVDVRLLLGEALLATGRYEQVRVEMMALARKHPNVGSLHRILGEAYLRGGQAQKAKESLRRAVELEPTDAVARELLGEAAEEEAPVSSTIERWFGDDEPKTVEQDLPPHFEEHTPLPRALPVDAAGAEPSVQVDPELAAEAAALRYVAEPPTSPRSTPTNGEARGAHVGRAGGAAVVRPRTPTIVPRAAPPRASSPAAPLLAPRAPAPSSSPSSMPPPVAMGRDAATHAGRNRARSPSAEPVTDEIDLLDLQPRAQSGFDPSLAEFDAQLEQDDDDDEDLPTLLGARGSALAPSSSGAQAGVAPGWHVPGPAPRAAAPAGSPRSVHPPDAAPGSVSRPGTLSAPPSVAPRAAPPSRSERPPAMALPAPGPAFPRAASLPSTAPGEPAPAPISSETVMRSSPDAAAPRPFLGKRTAPVAPSQAQPAADPRRSAAGAQVSAERPSTTLSTRRRPEWLKPRAVAVVGAIALLVLVAGGLGVRAIVRSRADDSIRTAALAAGADGRRASLDRVLQMLDDHGGDPWHAALRARLLATLTLEHSQDRAAEVESALAQLGRDGAALPDARVARSLLLVSQGRGVDALGVLSGLPASGDELAEAFRARAWAASSAGRIAEAEESARQALAVRPGTARHASLHAVLRFQAGDAASALQVLDTVPNGATSPAVRIARARVLLESGGDPEGAAGEADAVLTELTPSASPMELGWAHLVRARLALRRGDVALARAAALEAGSRAPAFDESYGLTVIETLLRAGAGAEAGEALARLPSPPVDVVRRAALTAETALAANDLAAAETALMSAGAGPRADLLRGRLREANGDLDQARQLYERAAADAREALEGRTRAGSVLLRMSRPREARVQLDQALRLSPSDVEAVTLFVRAALASGDASAADTALQRAIAQRPDAIELVAARGSVLLALGRADEAIAVLEQACRARPEDPQPRVELGEAALRTGRRDVARDAFREALRLAPTLARAHLGTAQLALDDARWDDVTAALQAAESASAPAIELARLRAELAVARGLGAGAIESVEQLLSQHPRDASLLSSLGHLQSQAEADRDARSTFTRALRADPESYDALLGRAAVETRRGDLGGAARSIDRAERAARERGASSAFAARVAVARARLRFEVGDFDEARRLAEQALVSDPKGAEAHVVLANVAVERRGDPIPHFRAAIAGTRVPPEALGRLATRVSGDEACELARRYIAAAPEGYDREDVDSATRRCP